MSMKELEKTPAEILDYTRRWAAWLDTDTISSSTWSLEDGNVTIDSDSNTTTSATARISGGTDGDIDYITNQITTADGRVAERTFKLKIVKYRAE